MSVWESASALEAWAKDHAELIVNKLSSAGLDVAGVEVGSDMIGPFLRANVVEVHGIHPVEFVTDLPSPEGGQWLTRVRLQLCSDSEPTKPIVSGAPSWDDLVERFRREGPSTKAAREELLRELAILKSKHRSIAFPAIEEVGAALRMTWNSHDILVQVDVEDGFAPEWYARRHSNRESAARVGTASLSELDEWMRRL